MLYSELSQCTVLRYRTSLLWCGVVWCGVVWCAVVLLVSRALIPSYLLFLFFFSSSSPFFAISLSPSSSFSCCFSVSCPYFSFFSSSPFSFSFIIQLWMLRGFQQGVIKFVLITGRKAKAQEIQQEQAPIL